VSLFISKHYVWSLWVRNNDNTTQNITFFNKLYTYVYQIIIDIDIPF